MANEERVFQRGETVPIYSDVKDWDGNYITPTSIKITIYKPDETKAVDGIAMTEIVKGQYVHYYNTETTNPVGWYRTQVVEVDGTGDTAKTTIKLGGFELQ